MMQQIKSYLEPNNSDYLVTGDLQSAASLKIRKFLTQCTEMNPATCTALL
jgi:hypothetical protein